MKRKVKIRVDANSQIGLGHLIRCVALAHMLKGDYEISFYSLGPDQSTRESMPAWGFKLIELANEDEYLSYVEEGDVAILDGYGFDDHYQKKVKSRGAFLICIDDIPDRHFVADMVINHAPGIDKKDYQCEPYTQLCLGPEYALLRPEFLADSKPYDDRSGLLLCIGGADPLNLNERILESLTRLAPDLSMHLVLGSANKHVESINTYLKSSGQEVTCHSNLKANEMADLMRKCKFAIVPASGILMESLALGLIPLIGYYVDNQARMYQAWKDLGLFTLGDLRDQDQFEKHLKQFDFNATDLPVGQHIDGKSGLRIRNAIANAL